MLALALASSIPSLLRCVARMNWEDQRGISAEVSLAGPPLGGGSDLVS